MVDDRFKMSRNVLATDKVPDTIFGIPIVSRRGDYTEEDIAFFREYPEAGGYYDMGDGAGEWTKEGNYIPGELESRRGTWQAASGGASDVEAYVKRINAAVTDVIPFIKEHEGFRAQAYKDSVGKWTVGYGQTEINGRPVEEGDTISEEDASAFVAQRARENAVALYKQNPWMRNLSQGALSALYDVAYNLGASALSGRRSPTLNYDMESADMDWDSIVWRELPTYVKAGGKTLNGLVNRRNDAIRKWRTQ